MRRAAPWLLLGGLALAVAAGTAVFGRPDTGAPLARPAPARTAPEVPSPRPGRPTPAARPPPEPVDDPDDEVPDLPPEPFDLNRVYDAERGHAEALVARTDRLAACWSGYVGRNGAPARGRFTVELVVSGDGERSTTEANVVNEDVDDELQDCVSAAMADARFEPVVGVHRWVMPVPIPSGG